MILEDIRGLVARFDDGDTLKLLAQRVAIPSQSHQRPELYSVYLEYYCHILLLKQHDAALAIKFFLTCRDFAALPHDSVASIGFNIM